MRRRRLVSLFALALSGPAPTGATPPGGPLRIDFIDVGQGDAALVTSPTGKTVLIDGGPHESAGELVAFLRARHVATIDLILLTHRHADHLGGLATVVRDIGARMFMDAPFPHPSPAYAALLDALEARHVAVRKAERGRTVDLGGGAVMTLLSPPDPVITGSRSDVNANSVIARVDYGHVGVLFAADAERETERWLLGSAAPLRAQILKVPHHGSRYATTPRFLTAVEPTVAVISVGAGNEYGHPAAETMARIEARRIHLYRTDQDGTVTIESDGTQIRVATEHGSRDILTR